MRGISTLLATMRVSAALSFAAVLLATTAALVQPGFAALGDTLDLTENSPTSLSAIWDGSTTAATVTLSGTDSWVVTIPATISVSNEGGWIEPENSAQVNLVDPIVGTSNVDVTSDLNTPTDLANLFQNGLEESVGSTADDTRVLDVAFHDLAATSEAVPEPGSLAVLATGLVGVGWLRRRRTIN